MEQEVEQSVQAYFQQVCSTCGRCPDGLINLPRQFPTQWAAVETRVYVNMGSVTSNAWEHPGRAVERFKQGLLTVGWTTDEIDDYVTFAYGFRNAAGKSVSVKAWRACSAYVTADLLGARPPLIVSWDKGAWCAWNTAKSSPKSGRCVTVEELIWSGETETKVAVDWNLQYMLITHPDTVYDFPHMVDPEAWMVDLQKIKWILDGVYPVDATAQGKYEIVTDPKRAIEVLKACSDSSVHSCDIETANAPFALDYYSDKFKIIWVALSWEVGVAYAIPMFHEACMLAADPDVWQAFVAWAASPSYRVMHNGTGFDSPAFGVKYGLDVPTHFDTMLADGLINENRTHTLKHLAGIASPLQGNYEDMLEEHFVKPSVGANGKAKKPVPIPRDRRDYEKHLPFDVCGLYNCIDADVTLRVYLWEIPKLQAIPSPGWGTQLEFFLNHVMPCAHAYQRVSRAGMVMDMDRVASFKKDVLQELEEAAVELFADENCAKFSAKKAATFTEDSKYYVENGMVFGAYHVAKDCMQPLYDIARGDELELGAKDKLVAAKIITKKGVVVKAHTFGPADVRFNPGSPTDVGFMMRSVLRLRSTKVSRKTGNASWANKVISQYADTVPFVKKVLAFKKLDKAASTYVHPICNGYFESVSAKGAKTMRRGWLKDDGLVHPQFLLAGNDKGHGTDGEKDGGAVTGRISSRDPNGTNFAKHSKYGKRLYGLFRSRFHNPEHPFAVDDDHANKLWAMMSSEDQAQVKHFVLPGQPGGGAIIQADYSQLELRIFAIIVKVAWMLEKYRNGADLHWELAMRMFHVTIEDIVRDELGDFLPRYSSMRSAAKSGWFGPIYGESTEGMHDDMVAKGVMSNVQDGIITLGEVEEMLQETYALMPEFELFKQDVQREIQDNLCVYTVTGRRRYIPQANSCDGWTRSKALRQAVNSLVQGPGADCNNFSVRQIPINMAAAVGLTPAMLLSRQVVSMGMAVAARYGIPIGAVHDSSVLDVPSECVPEVSATVRHTMQSVPFEALRADVAEIPLVVDVEAGPSWSPMELATII